MPMTKEERVDRMSKFPWEYSFHHARSRCNNPSNLAYSRYGGRGIKCLLTRDEMAFLWERDKAYKMTKPSIDRIDNDGDYTIDNCQFIELSLNRIKDQGMQIVATKDGKLVGRYDSQCDAAKELGVSQSAISLCVYGKTKELRSGIVVREDK